RAATRIVRQDHTSVTCATNGIPAFKPSGKTDEIADGMAGNGGTGTTAGVSLVESPGRTDGARGLLGDLAAQREQLQHMQSLSISAPVLAIDPMALPTVVDAGRRATKARLTELEQIAERNLRAAQEARAAVAFQQQRLEEEASARMKAEFRIHTLNREVEQLRDEDGQQNGEIKAPAPLPAPQSAPS